MTASLIGPTTATHDLNREQREAVAHTGGPLRIIAGAGTGKTSTLTARFVHLVEHHRVPPHQILALTFSSKAADEMLNRVLGQLPGSYRRLWIQTFHSLCLRLIVEWSREAGKPAPRVLGDADRLHYARLAVQSLASGELRVHSGEPGRRKLERDLLTLADRAKDELLTPDHILERAITRPAMDDRLHDLAIAYRAYQRELAAAGAQDFGDLTLDVVTRLQSDPELRERTRRRFRHMLVDEFQDTNLAQFELLRLLIPHGNDLCVVGDANQAIYAFRGGRSVFMSKFERHFPGARTFSLTANYRSHSEILDAANRLIAHDKDREKFELVSDRLGAGGTVTLTEAANVELEAELIARRIATMVRDPERPRHFTEIAILFRSVRASAEPVIRALNAYGIPYSLAATAVIDVDAVQDVLAALRLVVGPPTWEDAARLAMHHGISGGARQELEQRLPFRGDRDAVLETGAWLPGDLSPDEEDVLATVRDVVAEAIAIRGEALSMLLYRAMVMTGRLTESLDSETARLFRNLMEQASGLEASRATPGDLLAQLNAGYDRDDDAQPDSPGGVNLLTVHAAKGLEWKVVFLTGMAETIFPVPMRLDREFDFDLGLPAGWLGKSAARSEAERAALYRQEERRLAYVAVTRAKEELHITVPRANARGPLSPSQFVAELGLGENPNRLIADEDGPPATIPMLRRRLQRRRAEALATSVDDPDAAIAIASLLLSQWASTGIVPGAVPLRNRSLPAPFDVSTSLRFSFSGLEDYDECPRRYLYAAVLRLSDDERSASLALGNAVHQALDQLNSQWKRTGTIPCEADVDQAIQAAWPISGFDCEPQRSQLLVRARAMIRRFFENERLKPERRVPVAVEEWVEAPFGNHNVYGKIDLVLQDTSGAFEIIDFKTGSRSDRKAKDSLQLFLYGHAWRHRHTLPNSTSPRVSFAFLKHGADRGYATGPDWEGKQDEGIDPDASLITSFEHKVDNLLSGIVANEFAPTPGEDVCKYCKFRWICPEG